MKVRRVENMAGGKGHVVIRDILEQEQLGEKCRMYAEVTLEPGCSLGVHERPVKQGDVTVTPSGHSHGLANTGETDLVFMALILLD